MCENMFHLLSRSRPVVSCVGVFCFFIWGFFMSTCLGMIEFYWPVTGIISLAVLIRPTAESARTLSGQLSGGCIFSGHSTNYLSCNITCWYCFGHPKHSSTWMVCYAVVKVISNLVFYYVGV